MHEWTELFVTVICPFCERRYDNIPLNAYEVGEIDCECGAKVGYAVANEGSFSSINVEEV